MVQKTSKFTDQIIYSNRNVTTSSNKHYPFSINRMALREQPNESGSAMKAPVSSEQPKEAIDDSDSAKLVGSKRQQAECSPTPTAKHQLLATNGSTGHLVYVRRKLENEHGKMTTMNCDTACSPGTRKFCIETLEKPEMQQEQTAKQKVDDGQAADEATSRFELQNESSSYWAERFNRLQDHLQYLDRSGLKDYVEKFRDFSVEDLNKYAIELEKRAIRLSLEEALQSKRVRDLNLLGKSSQ